MRNPLYRDAVKRILLYSVSRQNELFLGIKILFSAEFIKVVAF